MTSFLKVTSRTKDEFPFLSRLGKFFVLMDKMTTYFCTNILLEEYHVC